MFKVKINNGEKENEYLVFKEKEFTVIGSSANVCISCPNYFSLEVIPGQTPTIKYTNIEPVIINSNSIEYDSLHQTTNFSFGLPLSLDEYKNLYELYLTQMEENPTPEYQAEQEIQNDVECAKTLIKNHKRA